MHIRKLLDNGRKRVNQLHKVISYQLHKVISNRISCSCISVISKSAA